ncbi:MAG: HD domain-containing protein, partial [Planctomycetota bacterium]
REAIEVFDGLAPGEALWKRHSLRVADVSRAIGAALERSGEAVDPELLGVLGLFHDVGRSRTHGPAHGWVGYVLLRRAGLERYARGCVAHWIKGRTLEEVLRDGRWSPRFLKTVFDTFGFPALTLEDRVVALADSVVAHDRIVTVEERTEDLARRYGDTPFVRRNHELSLGLRRDLEGRMGESLERVLGGLPGR